MAVAPDILCLVAEIRAGLHSVIIRAMKHISGSASLAVTSWST